MKLSAEELTILEDALKNWCASFKRPSEVVRVLCEMIRPGSFHLLFEDDEFPPEAVGIAETLLLRIQHDLHIMERAGEVASWKEGETIK